MMAIIVPPIKCQGIKSKLVGWIQENLLEFSGIWYEPFMGSGVVGFNIRPKKAIFSDTNPHIINFYNDVKNNVVTPSKIKNFLEKESEKLLIGADTYYNEIRQRFNENPNSYDFLFLNRACFNGMMRFNSKGKFNVPFCKKPNRYAQAYITKIINQIYNIQLIIQSNDYEFILDSFDNIIPKAKNNDFIYCDPPYIDRYSDYFNSWNTNDEEKLYLLLKNTKAKFILSTWFHNKFRENIYINKYWSNFNIEKKRHFYHLGANIENRNEMYEALVLNYKKSNVVNLIPKKEVVQLSLIN